MADETTAAASAASTATPASPAPDLEARVVAAIRKWRDELIANGPIARATECWNHLEAALAHLAASILKEI
jgi:hypothetical protein